MTTCEEEVKKLGPLAIHDKTDGKRKHNMHAGEIPQLKPTNDIDILPPGSLLTLPGQVAFLSLDEINMVYLLGNFEPIA